MPRGREVPREGNQNPAAMPPPHPRRQGGGRTVAAARRKYTPSRGRIARHQPDSGMSLLAERISAGLVSHQPGWQLPRTSELVRRHCATAEEVHEALDELIERQIIRRSTEGHLYRASPAEFLIALDGLAGLTAIVDPLGKNLTCVGCGTATQLATEATATALRVPQGEPLPVLRLAWSLDGEPAAVSTAYLDRPIARPQALAALLASTAESGRLPITLPSVRAETAVEVAADFPETPQEHRPPPRPRAVSIQMDLPPAAVAKRLRLRSGQLAVLVTVLAALDALEGAITLTSTVLRPEMFRVTLTSSAVPAAPDEGQLAAGWPLAAADYRM